MSLIPLLGLNKFLKMYHGENIELLGQTTAINSFADQHKLSSREKEVMLMLLEGKNNREIAEKILQRAEIDKTVRPQNLELNQYAQLCRQIEKYEVPS